MKNSRTTLMELTREYRNILRKCFLLNLGIVLFAGSAQAMVLEDGDIVRNDYPVLNEDVVLSNGTVNIIETRRGWGSGIEGNEFTLSGNTVLNLKAQAVDSDAELTGKRAVISGTSTETSYFTIAYKELLAKSPFTSSFGSKTLPEYPHDVSAEPVIE